MIRLERRDTRIARCFAYIALLYGLSACNQTTPMVATASTPTGTSSGTSSQPASAFRQFPDIPIPAGAKMDVEKTLVFGSAPWFGQLALKASSDPGIMFDFFRNNLAGHNWQEVTSVRAPTSILTYMSDTRVLAIAIQSATLGGSDITVTVSPRGQNKIPSSGSRAVEKNDLMPIRPNNTQ
jgi:hypothetical protein